MTQAENSRKPAEGAMREDLKELLDVLKAILSPPEHKVDRRDEAKAAREVIAKAEAILAAPQPSADEPVADSYVQTVPDKCDRIVWRGRYIHLSVGQETTPQPFEDDWIPWAGGDCPVAGEVIVAVKDKNGEIDYGKARLYDWRHTGNNLDIIAYREVKP